MARLAVLASGSGSNFEAIARAVKETEHSVVCLICDRKDAYVLERAERLGVESFYVPYFRRERLDAEKEIIRILEEKQADLAALAGFMRLLSPWFIKSFGRDIINIHPSLLPKYPGTRGIEESFSSGDTDLGITIHWVDEGTDTGEIIRQVRFARTGKEPLEEIEQKIHNIEQETYPGIIVDILGRINGGLT